jgi:GTPase SAR1 family protein
MFSIDSGYQARFLPLASLHVAIECFYLEHNVLKQVVDAEVVLVGNKKDLESERAVTLEEGERLAKQINAVFLETSAKDNLCVNDLFQNIVLQIETLNGNMEAGEGKKSCLIS